MGAERYEDVRPQGTVHISLPWAHIVEPPPIMDGLTWSRRPVDWGLARLRSRLQYVVGGFRELRRPDSTIILCHSGMHVVAAGLAHRILSRSTQLVAVDFLLPPSTPRRLLRMALPGVDEFVVIRSGDAAMLGRLGIPEGRCRFVAFPAPTPLASKPAGIGDFVYSGGAAQRDWATLADALGQTDVPALVSCPDEAQEFPSNVLTFPLIEPTKGREFLRRSRFLVQAIFDNDQPSGPLLILDALSAGKPVVASDVSGARDYIEHGRNGLLVPPGDPSALAAAISALFADVERVGRMSDAALETASKLTADRFWREVLAPYVGSRRAVHGGGRCA